MTTDDQQQLGRGDQSLRTSIYYIVDNDDVRTVETRREYAEQSLPLFAVLTPDRQDYWAIPRSESEVRSTGLTFQLVEQSGVLVVKRGQEVLAAYSPAGWLDITVLPIPGVKATPQR
jgi:hypothetical protein